MPPKVKFSKPKPASPAKPSRPVKPSRPTKAPLKVKEKPQKLDLATKAWVDTVVLFGKTSRSPIPQKPTEKVKSIFLANKKSILEIWEVYTQRRDELSRKLITNQATALSYLLGFHLPNVARMMELLTRSNKRHHWNKLCSKSPVRLYDVGCGTGAMSGAYLQAAKADEVFLYDSSGPLLDIAKTYHEKLGTKNVRTSRKSIEDFNPEWFSGHDPSTIHVYLLGYVWNELSRNNPARRNLMKIITTHLEKNEKCILFIAEPALEAMSRPTMELRDILCDVGFQALYPCPHSNACPMLERPKDWCYSEGTWEQPDFAAWIDTKLDLDRHRHAGTMFMFASPALGISSDQKSVVVGRPVKEEGVERYKGFFDYLVCETDGINKTAPSKPKSVVLKGDLAEKI